MRRPIAARNTSWAQRTARFLARSGVRPNAVSVGSLICALAALLCLMGTAHAPDRVRGVALFALAAGCIQLRLLCNLFDGMIAVEFGQASRLGPIFNDFPDRPADVLILVGCGCAAAPPAWGWQPMLGWLAGALALVTAYVRVLGAAVGAQEHFDGPMAKQQRMAVATAACGVCALETGLGLPPRSMALALILIVAGCLVTITRRLRRSADDLQQQPARVSAPAAQTNRHEETETSDNAP